MPRYTPPKERTAPDEGRRLAERLADHAERALEEMAEAVGGPPVPEPSEDPAGAPDERVRQFLYMVTHDLQSPLSAMSLRLNLLERHVSHQDLDGICKDLTVLHDAYGRMRDLVESILSFAEKGTSNGVEDSVVLDEVLTSALRLYRDHPAVERAEIRLRRMPVVRGDPQALERLFGNLIGNAIKYRHGERPLRLEIHATADDHGGVAIHVEDNGIGFDPAVADSLFAPFVRAHDGHAPGHGIGLASSARIAKDHEATLSAHGTEGQGARFTLHFPVERVILARVVR